LALRLHTKGAFQQLPLSSESRIIQTFEGQQFHLNFITVCRIEENVIKITSKEDKSYVT